MSDNQDDQQDDDEAIVREAIVGKPLRQIARDRGLTVPEANRVIDLAAASYFSPEGLRRQMLLEARRLEELKQRVWVQAIKEGDLQAAAVYVKAAEQFATLIGMNSPLGHVVNVTGAVPEPEETRTSTQKMLEAIRLLKAEPVDPSKPN